MTSGPTGASSGTWCHAHPTTDTEDEPGGHEGGHVQLQGEGHVGGDLAPKFGRVFESLQKWGWEGCRAPPTAQSLWLPKWAFPAFSEPPLATAKAQSPQGDITHRAQPSPEMMGPTADVDLAWCPVGETGRAGDLVSVLHP